MRALVVLLVAGAVSASAATIEVLEGQSIQAAIAAAADGDVVEVGAGTFVEDVDFLGKSIHVRGRGSTTVLRGTGTGSVVRFVRAEGPSAVLDSVLVTGGSAPEGGGIYVRGADPTIVRNVIVDNRAVSRGSGVHLEESAARVFNNLIVYNATAGGDPHSVQIVNASPTLVNNTIARGDSNGILVSGASSRPVIVSNILAYNGSRPRGEEARGRGICDFGPATVLQWNLFHRNRRGAVLTSGGGNYRRVGSAERAIDDVRIADNVDGSPRFVSPGRRDFRLRPASKALRAGNPDPAFDDVGGGRNTIGHLGGPYAAPSTIVP